MRVMHGAAHTFPLYLEGDFKASELVRLGNYDLSDDLITDERFPVVLRKPVARVIEFIEFGHDPADEEVLMGLAHHNLDQPTHEDALWFGVKYPEEQRKRPLVFLHDLVVGPYGAGRGVLVLSGNAERRFLEVFWFGRYWFQEGAYAGVRKDLLPL